MANAPMILLLLATLLMLTHTVSAARPGRIPQTPAEQWPKEGLAVRLKLEGEASDCWKSLVELQACTGEVILFFLNGETYLGPNCCQAIRIIGQHCWPAMFGAIGFTSEEADLLQGFCESFEPAALSPSPVVGVGN